jgi:ABC-type polysaccharide/polyol phosphate export permease
MSDYLTAMWRCRYFWLSLIKMDLRIRYRGSALGLGWSLVQPLAMTVIICTVFHNLFHTDITTYAPYVLIGLSFWNLILNVTLQGCTCFRQAEPYIRQCPAPLAIYPLRIALSFGFHFCLALVVVVVVASILRGSINPIAVCSLVPTTILLMIVAWALATLAGLMNVHFPDTRHLAEVCFQALFYLTPIIYPPHLITSPTLIVVFGFNPLVPFLRLLRDPVLNGTMPPLSIFVAATLITAAIAGLATYSLHKLEKTFIFYL